LARQVWWLAEQPSSSVAHFLEYIQLALAPAQLMIGFAQGLLRRMWFGVTSVKDTLY
jgi:hypothetical protein